MRAVGEFFWDLRASTLVWIDSANSLAAVFLMQVIPFDGAFHRDFRRASDDYLGRREVDRERCQAVP